MTSEVRAARDRLARYAAPGAPPFPPFKVGPGITHLTAAEVVRLVAQITEGIRDTLAPDLRLVLAALDRHEAIAEHDRRAAQAVCEEWNAGRSCEDCSCCTAGGCRNGPGGPVGQRCPSNSLGESACPCTGD